MGDQRIHRTTLNRDQIRALGAPALLADDKGHLIVWDGNAALTRIDGTVVRDDDVDLRLVGAPVMPLMHIIGRTKLGCDELAVQAYLMCGRDIHAESVAPGPSPAIPIIKGKR